MDINKNLNELREKYNQILQGLNSKEDTKQSPVHIYVYESNTVGNKELHPIVMPLTMYPSKASDFKLMCANTKEDLEARYSVYARMIEMSTGSRVDDKTVSRDNYNKILTSFGELMRQISEEVEMSVGSSASPQKKANAFAEIVQSLTVSGGYFDNTGKMRE